VRKSVLAPRAAIDGRDHEQEIHHRLVRAFRRVVPGQLCHTRRTATLRLLAPGQPFPGRGVAVALLTIVPTYMIYFVVQPMPAGLVIKQIVFDGALTVILGIIVARLFRSTPPAAAR
jgi:hypothetical protein